MVADLIDTTNDMLETLGDEPSIAVRNFIERVTFAETDEILAMLDHVMADDRLGLPPWARNLAYRLACLQRPDDPEVLREAAADLLFVGPDWDVEAGALMGRAARLESRQGR